MSPKENNNQIWILTSFTGIVLFVILYVTATFYYPGGSQFDKNATGFSWANNYWCNLLSDTSINGQENTAQPVALIAMFFLCTALSIFWWQFPKYTTLDKRYKLTIQVCGTLAMAVGFFLFTKFAHDFITNLASLLGLIATTGTFTGLYKNGWKALFWFGLLNVVLIAANNFLYYNEDLICYLPLVQKITFAMFLIWIGCIEVKMYELVQTTKKKD